MQTSLDHTMKQKLSIIILTLLLISATLTGCTVSQQNPQASLAQTLQPTNAPSQQGALPPGDYNIPNEPMRGSGIVVYDDTMFMENTGGYYFSIINDVLYYLDEDNYICTLDIKSKKITKLPEKIDDIIHYSVQFHNYLIYFCGNGILGFNIDTKRIYTISPDYADEWEIYATNDSIYMVLDRDMVYRLTIEGGKAKIDPMKALNEALKTLLIR